MSSDKTQISFSILLYNKSKHWWIQRGEGKGLGELQPPSFNFSKNVKKIIMKQSKNRTEGKKINDLNMLNLIDKSCSSIGILCFFCRHCH